MSAPQRASETAAVGQGPGQAAAQRRALVLGGARSGKSDFALKLARSFGEPVLFVATASAGDAEMAARIEAHRRARPAGWRTIEAPVNVGAAIRDHVAGARTVLLDCLSLLVSNCLPGRGGSESESSLEVGAESTQVDPAAEGSAAALVDQEIESLLAVVEASRCHLVAVSNEVGLGIVPAYPAGRLYRDLLGLANQRVARAADAVYLVVAGLPVELKQLTASVDGPTDTPAGGVLGSEAPPNVEPRS